MKTIYLFLDFDGVLHPFFPEKDLPDEENQFYSYAKNLEKVLLEYENRVDIKIVFSTSWRYSHNMTQLTAELPEGIASRAVGITPLEDEANIPDAYSREFECMQYLTQNQITDPWLALDDCPEFFDTKENVLVCPNYFKDEQANQLRYVLNKLVD